MASDKPIALVTGASSGIGEAIAKKLTDEGYTAYGTSRRVAHVQERSFPLVALDVNSDESVACAVEMLLRREGRIDLLVNNAGFGIAPAGAEESSSAQAQAIFNTNFFGLVRTTRAVVPHMRAQGGGRIINIGSIIGLVPMPYVALYAASKHAVEGYSEALDHELRTHGIRVSVIEPAFTKTQFETNNIEADAKLDEYNAIREHLAGVLKDAMKTADDPVVVAEAVLKAVRAKSPKLRYAAGAAAGQLRFLRKFAPESVLDAGVRRSLKLGELDRDDRKRT